jgi:hypothetical protein
MAVSKPHHTDRGTVAAISSARKKKYSGKKKEIYKEANIGTGKRVFVERKIVKYRMPVNTPGYKVMQLYRPGYPFYGTVVGKPPNSKLYKVHLDLLPSDCNEILVVRKDINVLTKGEESQPVIHDTMQ